MTEEGLKYLSDIKKAIELIEDFTSSITNYNEYLDDKKTQSAVERQLGIIGEAVNKFDQIHPEISPKNARKIVNFRNLLKLFALSTSILIYIANSFISSQIDLECFNL